MSGTTEREFTGWVELRRHFAQGTQRKSAKESLRGFFACFVPLRETRSLPPVASRNLSFERHLHVFPFGEHARLAGVGLLPIESNPGVVVEPAHALQRL